MFGAVKIYQDFNHRYPPHVDQYGLRFVSEHFGKCETYVKEHPEEFVEAHGCCYPAIVSFEPKDFPKTWDYHKTSPDLHMIAYDDMERMARLIVQKFNREGVSRA